MDVVCSFDSTFLIKDPVLCQIANDRGTLPSFPLDVPLLGDFYVIE